MSQYSTVEERVAAGVAVLDAAAPDWVDRIDLDDLDLSEPGYCVLGQVFGGYSEPLADLSGLGGTYEELHQRDVWAVAHGFEVHFGGGQSGYDRLEAVWRGIIEERKHGEVPLN